MVRALPHLAWITHFEVLLSSGEGTYQIDALKGRSRDKRWRLSPGRLSFLVYVDTITGWKSQMHKRDSAKFLPFCDLRRACDLDNDCQEGAPLTL